MTACSLCGSRPADEAGTDTDPDAVPLTWATSLENGEQKVYCPQCAREHLRSIEAKLDSPWW